MTEERIDDQFDSITITSKGKYAEIMITRGENVWRMLVDEKNLAKFVFAARSALEEMRKEA